MKSDDNAEVILVHIPGSMKRLNGKSGCRNPLRRLIKKRSRMSKKAPKEVKAARKKAVYAKAL